MKRFELHSPLTAALAIFVSTMPHSARAGVKPTEPDKPVLLFMAVDVTSETRLDDPDPHADHVMKALAKGPEVFSVGSITPSRDGIGVNVILNEKDRQALADLAQRFPGKYLYCSIPVRGAGVVVFPIDKTVEGMFTFSQNKSAASGEIAEYLRKRFRLTQSKK